MTVENRRGTTGEGINPHLFVIYVRANTIMPQVSDGIKWIVHEAILQNPAVIKGNLISTGFNQEQLRVLKDKSNRLHHTYNVPAVAQGSESPLPSSTLLVGDNDYQGLWKRVVHSFAHNLFFYQKIIAENGNIDTVGHRNDIDHDRQIPSPDIIDSVEAFISGGGDGLSIYRKALKIVVLSTEMPKGRKLLKDYRLEFGRGKRTSAVWRNEGYGENFAQIVKTMLAKNGLDVKDPRVIAFLSLNNLINYGAFTNDIENVED
ncbi:MAG: hypothetical protein AAB907_00940 [Patescibacteria group bacterium]